MFPLSDFEIFKLCFLCQNETSYLILYVLIMLYLNRNQFYFKDIVDFIN